MSSKFYREASKAECNRAETELADGIEKGDQEVRKGEGRNRYESKGVAACLALSSHGNG